MPALRLAYAASAAGILGTALMVCPPLSAQRGDRANERQPDVIADLDIPPAPVLSAEEALRSFVLAPGITVELVAAEPLVHDPIALAFAPDGRLWVVEMRGFMPDADGAGELEPNGRIVVLQDTDGDGTMDESTVFLDGLVLPRAVGLVADGALVIEPPHLWFCRDTDGDGRCDDRELVADGFDEGLQNPEHAGNGVITGLDNWIQVVRHGVRFRRTDDGWQQQRTLLAGQWGISQDDWGRWFYNYNSDQLRADLYAPHYAVRNGHLGTALGVNHRVIADQSVWPVRVTPGINRGYRDGMLRDGRLTTFTAVCGPMIYRGDLFPRAFAGNAFVCEPAAHLVRRNRVRDEAGGLVGENAYQQAEFLASTDERFRPVNVYTGPDGAIYVVDMYRGVVQHRNFVTSFLRRQIDARGLAQPIGLGRIWRVRPSGRAPAAPLDLDGQPVATLVRALHSANGIVRDLAQRLLVERGDRAAVDALRTTAATAPDPRTRLHALWTLEGLGRLTPDLVTGAFAEDDPRLRVHALRLLETLADHPAEALLATAAADPALIVRRQLALTLGELELDATVRFDLLARLVREDGDAILRSAAVSSLHELELAHLYHLLQDETWHTEPAGGTAYLALLARCVGRENAPARIESLRAIAAAATADWQRDAIRAGLEAGQPRRKKDTADDADPATATARRRGHAVYLTRCAACHQPDGAGLDGLAPPLRTSDWLDRADTVLTRIVLHGLSGPIEVDGKSFDMHMPGQPMLDDEDIAAVLTWLRTEWADNGPVTVATVHAVREATATRVQPWRADELAH